MASFRGLEVSLSEEYSFAEKEQTRRLMEDEANAVSLFKDCVAHGDADTLLEVAKCFALGHGMKHDAERAEVLFSESAEKGNKEAERLMELINKWKGKQAIDLCGLR